MLKWRPRVLVVDDNKPVLRHWSRVLVDQAFLVPACSLEEAWQYTEAEAWNAAPCDYVVLDLGLPDGDGADLLSRLESLEPRPSVAVISAYLDARRCLSLRGRCAIVLAKPVDGSVFRSVLDILEEARSGRSTIAAFAAQFRLSGQETRLLDAALKELTNEDAAELLGCAPSTVRSYWARIFHKVGCHCERDVIARLFRFAQDQTGSHGLRSGSDRTDRSPSTAL